MNKFFSKVGGQKYFAKVDNDTIVPNGWLTELKAVLDSKKDIDAIQAKHDFVLGSINDWPELLEKRRSEKFSKGNIIYNDSIGGSGILSRLDKIKELSGDNGLLFGWTEFTLDPQFTCAFYDGVEINLLDMDGCNKLSAENIPYSIETGRIDMSSIPNVSIIIPVIREDRVNDCIEAIKKNIAIPDDKYEILAEVDHNRIGCPKMVKKLTDKSKYDLVMFLGDDTVPQPGFMSNAVKAMNRFQDFWGLVGLNDGIQDGERCATHWLAHKKLLDYLENREFFFTGYTHQRCDVELTEIAKNMNRYIYAKDAKIKHNHPASDMAFDDEFYRDAYSTKNHDHDHKLFIERKEKRGYFKLGIGLPLTDVKVYSSFMQSFVVMDKPDFTLLMPKAPAPIEIVRRDLVVQALRDNCTHLIMMDTDQNYSRDSIMKLLSHGKDVVGTVVHRRYPPFDPIVNRGKLGNYYHVPDDDCFSGKLIEVDSVGFGCIMLKTKVFFDIPYPWFSVYRLPDGRIVGEDIDFCSKLRDLGYKIYVDTSIKIGHISHVEITRDFYMLYKKVKGFEWNVPEKPATETINS